MDVAQTDRPPARRFADAAVSHVAVATARILVYVVPLVFTVWAWFAGGGMPLFIDSNETYYMYTHARNMELFGSEIGFLSGLSTDWTNAVPHGVYTNNPNFPRYLNYGLLLIGIRDVASHVLIFSVLGSALAILLIWRLFAGLFPDDAVRWMVVPLLLAFDFVGFLAFTGNTYRIFAYILLWGCVAAIARPWPAWAVAAIIFLLFQFEYAFALFVSVTLAGLVLLSGWWGRWRTLGAAMVGAVASLVAYALQIIAFKGVDGLIADFGMAFTRRVNAAVPGSDAALPVVLFQRGVETFLYATNNTMLVLYSRWILWLIGWAVVSSCIRVALRHGTVSLFLARLLLPMLVGGFITAATLQTYFQSAYLSAGLPFLVFFVTVALAICALDIADIVTRVVGHRALVYAMATVLALVPLVGNSFAKLHQPFNGDAFRALSEYQGRSFLAVQSRLVFVHTGGRTMEWWPVQTPNRGPAGPPIELLGSFRDEHGTLYWSCLDLIDGTITVLVGTHGNLCAPWIEPMLQAGHTIVRQGPGYVIMEVNPGATPAGVEAPRMSEAILAGARERDARRKAGLPISRGAWQDAVSIMRNHAGLCRPHSGEHLVPTGRSVGSEEHDGDRPGDAGIVRPGGGCGAGVVVLQRS